MTILPFGLCRSQSGSRLMPTVRERGMPAGVRSKRRILLAAEPISLEKPQGQEIGPCPRALAPRRLDFRERVLRAYEYSCAVCGFDVRLGTVPAALEAAHIKWHQARGPDEEFNGLALYTLHHKLFDRGVFTLSDKLNIIVSESANGTKGFREWVTAFHGAALRPPQSPSYYPAKSVVDWHVREVFQFLERYKAPA